MALLLLTPAYPAAAQQGPSPRPEQIRSTVVLDAAALAAIDSLAREMIASGRAAGLGVGVVRNGQLLFDRSYGIANLEHDVPVTPQTVFNIFSITKTFTAAAILQLAERGQLRLDDKLARFFPGFPRGEEVTIRQLLSHTSGIRDYARPGEPLERTGATPDQLVQNIQLQTPLYDFDPGTKWSYSNSNYALLGKIIEQLSGTSYDQYMAEHIFSPLAMTRTAVDHNADVVPGRAGGYMLGGGAPGRFVNGIYIDMSTPFAAGAMRSTVSDLARGLAALFDGRIVSAASVREMTTPARVQDGRLAGDVVHGREDRPGAFGYYGLGVDSYSVCGHRSVGHGGSFPSFSSSARNYVDQDFVLVVLANTGRAAFDLEARIARMLLGCGPASASP